MRPQWCPNQPRCSLKSRVHGCPDNAWVVVQIYSHYPLCKVSRRKSNLVLNWYYFPKQESRIYFPKQESRMVRALWGGHRGSTGRQLTTPSPPPRLGACIHFGPQLPGPHEGVRAFLLWEIHALCGRNPNIHKNGKSERKQRPAADGEASEGDGREADAGWGATRVRAASGRLASFSSLTSGMWPQTRNLLFLAWGVRI